MKETVRVSFDVPIEEHTFLKADCVNAHVSFAETMREHFHKLYEERKKQNFHNLLLQGFQNSYEGKGRVISQEELDKWDKMVDSNE